MNLEETNKEYLEAKAKLEQANKDLEDINKRKNDANIEIRKHITLRNNAKVRGFKASEQMEQAEIDKLVEDIKNIKKELEEKKKDVKGFEDTINARIDEIKKDPATKQIMNEVLAKRYERQLKKKEKDKEEVQIKELDKLEEKGRYENLKNLIEEHPALEKNLNGIITAKETIKNLNEELSKLDYQKDAKRIAEITGKDMKEAIDKLNKNKDPLMNYINKNRINIKYEDIEKMAESGLGLDDTIDGLGKEIKGYDKEIKGYDKEIHNYSGALKNIQAEMGSRTSSTVQTNSPAPQSKPKWYQFGQRFKNWIQQRKQSQLPPAPQSKPNDIRDTLKYDIVKDAVGYDKKIKDAKGKVTGVEHVYGDVETEQLRNARKDKSDGSR